MMLPRILQSQLRNVIRGRRIPHLLDNNLKSANFTRDYSQPSNEQQNEQDNRHNNGNNHDRTNGRKSFKTAISSIAMLSSIIVSRRHYSSNNDPPDDGGHNVPPIIEDLQQAILKGDVRRVHILAKECTPNEINIRHRFGWNSLHLAAVHGHSKICEILLQHGARVNDSDLYSARAMAEAHNIDPLVVHLTRDTEFSMDLPRINFLGCTALHYAAMSNSLETIEVLERFGANPTLENVAGHVPAHFGNSRIVKELKRYEAEFSQRQKELEDEERRRYPLEQRVKDVIVGQESAIATVAATIRRKENGWFDDNHPLVFLFLGSSGIGKTELAKQVAKYLHKDNKNSFIRLDMSEYQEKHSVARMIGSPPGYIGHNEGGQLTQALTDCNNAVVLFDEVEKAHPQVLTVLLQLFDEGRMTDGRGKTIECKDAIFIMTSNLASEAIAEHATQLRNEQQIAKEIRLENRLKTGFKPKDQNDSNQHEEQITISRKFKDNIVRPILKQHLLKDEFLGRINEMVYFLPFSHSELRQLVVKELEFWAAKAKKNNNLELTWDNQVIDVICKGYDIHYGARSIKHEVERRIVNQISELHHTVKDAKKVHIRVKEHDQQGPDLIQVIIT